MTFKEHAVAQPLPALISEPADFLSPRELTMLRHLTTGRSSRLIAFDLKVSEASVYVDLKNLYLKIGAGNRTQAEIWTKTYE